MTFNTVFNKIFSDVWFYNEIDSIYMRVEGVEESNNTGIISVIIM